MIETFSIPSLDLELPRVGVGTVTFGGHWGPMDEEVAIATVRRAFDLGLRFFDTADCYGLGRAEELLAAALGEHRHEATVSTKFGVRWDDARRTWRDIDPRYMRTALEASLRRLRVERIPIYYIHWPDGRTPIEEVVGEMKRCRDEGKIGGIALSNPSKSDLLAAAAVSEIVAVQFQYSLVDRTVADVLMPVCKELHLPVLTWGSLAQGILAGRIDENSSFVEGDRRKRDANFLGQRFQRNLEVARVVNRLALEHERTSAQVAMRWLLDTPGVAAVLAGPKGPAQVEDYVGALGWRLSPDASARLESAARQISSEP